jgi:hypothetical protein
LAVGLDTDPCNNTAEQKDLKKQTKTNKQKLNEIMSHTYKNNIIQT